MNLLDKQEELLRKDCANVLAAMGEDTQTEMLCHLVHAYLEGETLDGADDILHQIRNQAYQMASDTDDREQLEREERMMHLMRNIP